MLKQQTTRNHRKPPETIQNHPKFIATNHKLPEILHNHEEIIVSIAYRTNPCQTFINSTPT